MLNIVRLATWTAFFSLFALHVMADEYDIVIKNGRVMDPETMLDRVLNVGIKDGRIRAITHDELQAKTIIDATGLVVAPGFIDTHFHALDPFATKMAVQDGVTTGLDLEAGASHVGQWYADKAATGWQINYGVTSGLIANRMIVHDKEVTFNEPVDASILNRYVEQTAKDGFPGWSLQRSNLEQLNQIMANIDEDLRQGAIGLGIAAAYMKKGLTSYELYEAQRTAARYGRLASVHTRYHLNGQTPDEAPIATDEVLANAMLLDAPLIIAHDNDYGWWENEEKLQQARRKGFNFWGEYYPFTAGSTFISAGFLKPETWEDINGYKYEETLYDPSQDRFLSKQEYLDISTKEPGHVVVVFIPARNDWIKYWLAMPEMVVASDAMPGLDAEGVILPYDANPDQYAGHPRTVSSYATTLKMAREQNVPLMFTLAQLSYWNAKHLGDAGLKSMQERGRMQIGMVADIAVFDAEKVSPRATYKMGENGLPSAGIPWVIVNGQVIVDNHQVKNIKAGQPIRYPEQKERRFEPLEWNQWLENHTIIVPDTHYHPGETFKDPREMYTH